MAEPAVGASGHRIRWGWWLVGLAVFAIVAALIGYWIVQPFSDWVNDVLGSLNIGE
jgi:zinc transporter ZupT